ncbi:glycosyltransferase family 4 protein [Alteromonas gracilis]|uniref:glycosyltransferase family 4 protein n=1 Tax=Alteromonas gracilis TaxID=1479524 RepID=UPI002FE0AA9D
MIYVNAKYKHQKVTGVQRYTHEILKFWREKNFEFLESEVCSRLTNISEQLLFTPKDKLLWCPTNTGPILNRNKVVTLHDCAVLFEPSWFSKRYAFLRKLVIPQLVNSSKGIITVSNFSKSIISESLRVEEKYIKVIPNGIDHQFFNPSLVGGKSERGLGYFSGKPYFLIVGSLDPRKNIAITLEAWSKLPKQLSQNFDLVIVGCHNKNFAKIVHPDAVDLNGVHYLGYVGDEELRELYANAHAFLFPSMFEGFGLPVLEAMAMRVPVICSNSSALPEVCGDAVRYIDPTDVDDLIEAIVEISSNEALRLKLVKLGVAHCQKYSWEATAEETYNYLKDCV